MAKLNDENYITVKQLLKDWKVEEREEKEEETVREGKIIKRDAEKEIVQKELGEVEEMEEVLKLSNWEVEIQKHGKEIEEN